MSGIEEEQPSQPSQPSQQAQASDDTENRRGVKEIIKVFEDKQPRRETTPTIKKEIDNAVNSERFKQAKVNSSNG